MTHALKVLGTLSIKVEFSKQGLGGGGDIETLIQILVLMMNLNNNNQVNFVKVRINISKSSLSILPTPEPLSKCSNFPIFLGKLCNFFSILSYIFLY